MAREGSHERDTARDGGFTLLEVLAAFVIAALALGALTQGAAGGLQSARVAGHYQEALSRAQSRLATIGATLGAAPAPGVQDGDDGGGYRWRVSVVQIATAARGRGGADPPRPGRAQLLAVTVRVSWRMDGGERDVVLATERLVTAPPEPP